MHKLLSNLAMAAALSLGLHAPVNAADNDKPVRIITAFSTGAGADAMLRIIGARLAARWNRPVIIDNRPGGGGAIAVEAAKRQPTDGSVLLHGDSLNFTAVPWLYKRPNAGTPEFEPVSALHQSNFLIAVAAASPWHSVADLIAAAKARPGQITYGSWQIGSVAHLGAVSLEQLTGTRMSHIPFKDFSTLYTSVARGDVEWALGTTASLDPFVKSGKVRYLGVAAGERDKLAPNVPTVAESGGPASFRSRGWVALLAPIGTPLAIRTKIADDIAAVMSEPDLVTKLANYGFEPMALSPTRTAALLEADSKTNSVVIKSSNISLN